MSLDSLSNQIKAEAKAEAETIIKAAEKQAKGIRKEAEDEAKTHVDAALARAEKDAFFGMFFTWKHFLSPFPLSEQSSRSLPLKTQSAPKQN